MSFSPKYTITTKLLCNIKEITKLGVEFNYKKLPQSAYSEIFENTRSLGAKTFALSSDEEKNYFRALEKFSKKNIDFSTNLILTIHAEVMKDLAAKNNVGRFRNNGVKNNIKNLVKFVNINRELDPVILAGLFYKQFLNSNPFVFANERVCILSSRVLLRDLDINIFNLFAFEKIGEVNQKDNTKWLEYFSDCILNEMLRIQKSLSTVNFKQDLELNDDQKKILKYLKKYGAIDDSKYSKITQRKKATRVLDFNKLISYGLIERCDQGRNTHYILK